MPLWGNRFFTANINYSREKRYTIKNTLTYEEALHIYTLIQKNLDRTDEDIVEIYNSMLQKAGEALSVYNVLG